MILPQFDYHRPESVEEAIDVLSAHAGVEPEILAGGHSLVPDMKNAETDPGVVVDIGAVPALAGVTAGDDETVVGATTTYDTVATSEHLEDVSPALADAAAEVGDVQVRNRGTVCGNLAYADPAADLPAAAIACDATLRVRGPDGDRDVDAERFIREGARESLAPADLVTGLRVPHVADAGAYVRETHPASGYALAGVAARVAVEDGTITDARVAATGVTDHAVRLPNVEEALEGATATSLTASEAADGIDDDVDPDDLRSDPQVSGPFRLHVAGTVAEEAITRALDRAGALGGGGET